MSASASDSGLLESSAKFIRRRSVLASTVWVVRMTIAAPALTAPALMTRPVRRRTLADSPVNSDSSKSAMALSRMPSTGTASPVRIQSLSPTATVFTGVSVMCSAAPVASMRMTSAACWLRLTAWMMA